MAVPPVAIPAYAGIQHRHGRRCDLVAAGVPARHFLDPGSESGVTNDRQFCVSRGTIPPMKCFLAERGISLLAMTGAAGYQPVPESDPESSFFLQGTITSRACNT